MMSPGVILFSLRLMAETGSWPERCKHCRASGEQKNFSRFCSDMKQRIFLPFHIGTSIAVKCRDCDPDPSIRRHATKKTDNLPTLLPPTAENKSKKDPPPRLPQKNAGRKNSLSSHFSLFIGDNVS
ncbi:TPA: hypothetical protein ACHOZF_003001 [Raoultella planticola]